MRTPGKHSQEGLHSLAGQPLNALESYILVWVRCTYESLQEALMRWVPSSSRRSRSTFSDSSVLLQYPVRTPRPCRSRDEKPAPFLAGVISCHSFARQFPGATPGETVARPPDSILPHSGQSGSSDGESKALADRLLLPGGMRIESWFAGCRVRKGAVEYPGGSRAEPEVEYSVEYSRRQLHFLSLPCRPCTGSQESPPPPPPSPVAETLPSPR